MNEMAKQSLGEQLNRVVDAVLAPPRRIPSRMPASLSPLAQIVADLRGLPREDFRNRLKSDLQRRATMASKPVAAPEVRQSATAYLCVHDAVAAIDFYKRAFNATEVMRLVGPGTKIGHAEIRIGNSSIFLSDEFPEYGSLSPHSLGGSSAKINLKVENVDALAPQAVDAGAKITRPVADQFYGERSGHFSDPFGYTWILSSHIEDVSETEMQRRFESLAKEGEYGETEAPRAEVTGFIRQGFSTVTPYVVSRDAAGLIEFVKSVFGAEETFRDVGSAGGIHCEVRVGDSMMMLGGGGPGLAWKGESKPMAFHVYVKNADAAYHRALEAGGVSILPPTDQPYGERSASVKDASGNFWYVATAVGDSYKRAEFPNVQSYMHPLRAEPVIRFLQRAFGAVELARYASPDGVLHHASVKIGTGFLEMGEAHGPYQPMPGMYYLYVPNADAMYRRAIAAGAKSNYEPTDMPYGDRLGSVTDAFGNEWCIATHLGRQSK